MQLRHIRPGSVDWQDALTQEVEKGGERLSPEEITRLRMLTEEQQLAPPAQDKRTPTAA